MEDHLRKGNAVAQAASNASLVYAAKQGTAAETNKVVERDVRTQPSRGNPLPAPNVSVMRGDGTVVRKNDGQQVPYAGDAYVFRADGQRSKFES